MTKKEMFWFDFISIFFLLILIPLIIVDRRLGWNNWGLAIGISLFTIWNILSLYLGKKKSREIYAENYIFLFIFAGYTILSWMLVSVANKFISPITFVIFILIVIAFFYGLAFTMWAKILIKNTRKIWILILSYFVITFIIITLFVGLYSGIGNLAQDGKIIDRANLKIFDYYYFSVMTFTSGSYGEYYPLGEARLVALIESYLGMAFNVLVIGIILGRFFGQTNLNKILKGEIKIKGIGKKKLELLKKSL